MSNEFSPVCVHGTLARKCEICEQGAELATLRTRLASARKVMERIKIQTEHVGKHWNALANEVGQHAADWLKENPL